MDEIDDAIGALRLASLGVAAEVGLVVAGGVGIGAIGAALAADAEFSLTATASIILCLAAALKIHGSETRTSP